MNVKSTNMAHLFSVLPNLIFMAVAAAGQPVLLYKDCGGQGNYSDNSNYHKNLKSLLTSMYSNTQIPYGFYNFTACEEPDRVYGIALCRPDISPPLCQTCIKNVSDSLPVLCPNFKETVGEQDDCLVRYTFRPVFRLTEMGPYFWVYSLKNISDVVGFNLSRSALLFRLGNLAAAGDSRYKYATGQIEASESGTIYGLVQCTPDLTGSECRQCLINATGLIPQCCPNRSGGRLIFPSYVPVTTYEIEEVESLQFDLGSIRLATDDFSEAMKLGEGGFGVVYMGALPNGQEIAVKWLSKGSGQGEVEFKNEVLLVAKLQHRNLVRLLGFCYEGEERLLVYEFVPNSSLNNFIFDPIKRANLDWATRYKIIGGIARGLVYLHEDSPLRIIHRDLKASNILLDAEMTPKISDFGMARLFAIDQTQDDTNRIVGTFGYMAPEYVRRGHFSVKSDVFSFGVLILEIVSGQKNTGFRIGEEEEHLLTYAWRNWNEGTTLDLMDPSIREGSRSEMMRCIHIGLLCVQESEANRPTMTQIITMLSSNSITLIVPSKPAFFLHADPLGPVSSVGSTVTESDLSKSGDVNVTINEASITQLYPR
ncbi:cysteine-rich RLK (RECEPTOR-like protein kinase) 8 [Euphorbia peplus]|nr:cysteine-rich RLK (RECEPTOR-like protein kinase) 8 [Euphorbia peplus]